jgi:hypothetical protein
VDGALGQQLTVVRNEHPAGERGVRTSLDIVAKKVAEGGSHPKVRAWAVEQLERARRLEGVACKTDRERADVLLRAVQKKLWVPDPIGTEFMAGAHLMACDRSTPEELCFMSDDCDGLAILLGSCFLSVGLHCMVVGHAYDRSRSIQHVLLAVRLRKQGGVSAISGGQHDHEWVYADPSLTHLKLGQVTAFTRERLLSVPEVKVICDENNCLVNRDYDPDALGFVQRGLFVGVDGVPDRVRVREFAWLGGGSGFEWLGNVAEDVYNRCTGGGDISQIQTDKQGLKGYAECAADAYCATYGVPPGICSTVAQALFDAIDDVFSNAGGAQSPSWFALMQLRLTHDRLLPSEPKWGSGDAYAAGPRTVLIGRPSARAPDVGQTYAPIEMVELVKRNGWNFPVLLDHTGLLLRPRDYPIPEQSTEFYYGLQKLLLAAVARSNNELIGRAERPVSAARPSRALPIAVGAAALLGVAWYFLR